MIKMKISVKVKPHSKTEKIEQKSEKEFTVFIKAPPEKGEANASLIRLLADYFNIPRSRITLLKGSFSRQKLVEILLGDK